MAIELATSVLFDDLARALNSCAVSMEGAHIICDSLPGSAMCAATLVEGVLWLVVDLDKAAAPRHALAMIREVQAAVGHCPQFTSRAHLALVS